MKREARLAEAIDEMNTLPRGSEECIALARKTATEFEDIIPTYRGVKLDAVSRLWEYARRDGKVDEEVVVGNNPTEVVVDEVTEALVSIAMNDPVPVKTPRRRKPVDPNAPKKPRKPRAKKTAE